MIFAARGIMVSLAFFAVVYSFLSLLALLVWRALGVSRPSTPRSANFLFGLRVLPFVLSSAVTLFLAFPSFLLLERHSMDEDDGTFALSASALLFLGAGLYRVTSAEARTRRVVSACLEGATGLETGTATPAVLSPRSVLPMMLIGIRVPRVLIAEAARSLLSDEELLAAMRHEIEHIHSRDNLKKVFLNCIPFPGLAALEREWQEAAELAADRRAVSNRAEALDLAAALIKLSRHFPPQAAPAFATGLVSVTGSVGMRVERLLLWEAGSDPARIRWRAAIPLALAAILALATNLTQVLVFTHYLTDRLVP